MKSWFSKIETAEQAEKAIKEVSWSLYFLAGLNLLIVLFLHRPAVLQEVFLLVVLGFQFKRTRSRCVAFLIAGYALFTGVLTALARFGLHEGTGTNIVLAIIVIAIAVRGVQASIILHREHETRINVKAVVILSIVATSLSAVGAFAVLVGAIAGGYDLQKDADASETGAWLLLAVVASWLLVFGRMLPFVRRLWVVKPAQP